jgi:chromatin assembly factor 1 subunit B
MARQDSTAMSDAGSVFDSAASDHGVDDSAASVSTGVPAGPLTPSASMPGTPAMPSASAMKPPSSRRSSMSSSVAASPPPPTSRFARSPSPLPAIRPNSQPPTAPTRPAVSNKLYGDESYTHYFRRLTFSPDGALLLTPAGQIESSLLAPSFIGATGGDNDGASASKDKKPKRPAAATDVTKPTVYIYSRANLSNGPIAHLPGQRTASVAVRFNPILYDLRDGKAAARPPKTIVVDETSADEVKVRMYDAVEAAVVKDESPSTAEASSSTTPLLSGTAPVGDPHLLSPSPSPAPPTLSTSSSTFALPYRMYFAVATQDAVLLYDTQQTSPIAIFVGLHYAGFTDLTWSPDGQTLLLSSIDGYCTVVVSPFRVDDQVLQTHTADLLDLAGLRPRRARLASPHAAAPEAAPGACPKPVSRFALASALAGSSPCNADAGRDADGQRDGRADGTGPGGRPKAEHQRREARH